MFPKELKEWILHIALIYIFMRVTLVLPPMRITFMRSAAQRARLFRFQTYSHLYCTESQIQTYWKAVDKQEYRSKKVLFNILILPVWDVFSSNLMKRSHTLRLSFCFNSYALIKKCKPQLCLHKYTCKHCKTIRSVSNQINKNLFTLSTVFGWRTFGKMRKFS